MGQRELDVQGGGLSTQVSTAHATQAFPVNVPVVVLGSFLGTFPAPQGRRPRCSPAAGAPHLRGGERVEKEEEPHLLQGEGQQGEPARWAGESVWEQERQRWDTDLRAGVPETGNGRHSSF